MIRRNMVSVLALDHMPNSTLISIYRTLNVWQWPEILGSQPEGWDSIPNYKKADMDECLTKADIIRPYMMAIQRRIPHESIYQTPRNH